MLSGLVYRSFASIVTYPKKAHMTEQTDQPSLSTDEPDRGTHLVVTHAKAVARGSRVGLAKPGV